MKDDDPRMRIQAIRRESEDKAGNSRSFDADYRAAITDKDRTSCAGDADASILQGRQRRRRDSRGDGRQSGAGVQEIGTQMLKPAAAFARGGRGGPPFFAAKRSR